MEQLLSPSFTVRNLSLVFLGHSPASIILNLLLLCLLIIGIVYLAFFCWSRWRRNSNLRFLELVPSAFNEIDKESFEAIFTLVHGLGSDLSLKNKFLSKRPVLSFEIISTYEHGVSFIIGVPDDLMPTMRQNLRMSLNGLVINERPDYLEDYKLRPRLISFKLKKPYYFSLKTDSDLSLTTALGDLNEGEMMAFQLVVSPLSERLNRKARHLLNGNKPKKRGWLIRLVLLPMKLKRSKQVNEKTAALKFEQPLFSTSLRLIVDSSKNSQRLKGFRASLGSFADPGVQSLTTKRIYLKDFLWRQFKYRLPGFDFRHTDVLSVHELAGLYHFPSNLNSSEDIKVALSKSLNVPLDVKRTKDFDVILGENDINSRSYSIGLTSEERARHVYVIGGTGNGKTTMLEYMARQDMASGKGLAIIDPHGDMAKNLLKYIPKNRVKDVIYFNPSDLDYPIGLNLLETKNGLFGSKSLHEKELVVESVISVLRRIYEPNYNTSAYRIERLLRNAVYSAMTVDNATIFTVLRVLSDKYYRWEVIKDLKDPSLKRFWEEEFNKAGDFQRVKLALGPITRLERFERSVIVKRILGQARSTIDFDDILNSGKILICNLSKGALGEDTSALLGSVILSKLQLAALRREAVEEKKRRPFYLYIDEFQNFASSSFISMLSEARKYGLNLTMAQQSTSQIEDKAMTSTILDNVGSLICFRLNSPESERFISSQFAPYINKNELTNLPRYNFYAKLSATEPKPPMSGRTILLKRTANLSGDKLVINSSRKLYAKSTKQTIES